MNDWVLSSLECLDDARVRKLSPVITSKLLMTASPLVSEERWWVRWVNIWKPFNDSSKIIFQVNTVDITTCYQFWLLLEWHGPRQAGALLLQILQLFMISWLRLWQWLWCWDLFWQLAELKVVLWLSHSKVILSALSNVMLSNLSSQWTHLSSKEVICLVIDSKSESRHRVPQKSPIDQ